MMIKVVIAFPLDDEYLHRIGGVDGVRYVVADDEDSLIREIEDAEVLFAYRISEKVAEKAERLKWIQSPFVGVDSLMHEAIREKGVVITCSRGIHYSQASDHTFALILAFARKLPELFMDQKNRVWKVRHPIPFHPLDELAGKTLGIIGLGSIGREIARKGKCFGMKVIGIRKTRKDVEWVDEIHTPENLDLVLQNSDYLVLCVPATAETTNLIGERELKKMKNSAYLINIARGDVVDEKALIRALREKWIAGAAIDVTVEEPLPSGSPLWELDNLIITPHVAGSSPYYWDRAVEIFVENLKRFIRGEELVNVVDWERGY